MIKNARVEALVVLASRIVDGSSRRPVSCKPGYHGSVTTSMLTPMFGLVVGAYQVGSLPLRSKSSPERSWMSSLLASDS